MSWVPINSRGTSWRYEPSMRLGPLTFIASVWWNPVAGDWRAMNQECLRCGFTDPRNAARWALGLPHEAK